MSFIAKLYLDGEERNVLNAQNLYYQITDQSGKPSAVPNGGFIELSLEATKHDNLYWDWMLSSTSMKQGNLRFFRRDGMSKLFDLEFWDCYCIKIDESYSATGGNPMTMTLTLSPGIIRMRGKVYEKKWKISDPFTKAVPLEKPEPKEEKNPTLDSFNWVHREDDTKIEVAEFGETVRGFIKVTDIDVGEIVNVKMYAKSNGNFNNTNYMEYEAEVQNHFKSTYAIFEMKLSKDWAINVSNLETDTIDELFIEAAYDDKTVDFSSDRLEIVAKKLKGIYLKKGNDEAYYYQGELYGPTKDNKGMVEYTERPRRLFREIKEALDIIYSKPKGKTFIDKVINRSNPKFITITREGGVNKTRGNLVSWAPGDKNGGLDEKGSTKREPFISLAHEMWHAWENWLRIANTSVWIQKTDKHKEETFQELSASKFENKIRSEHQLPKRKWYGYIIEENGTKTEYGKIF